jgi:hypothetical protein
MTILVAANFGSLAMASATALVLGLLTTLKSSPGALDPQSENHGSGDRLGNGNESTGKQQRERSEVSQSTVARRDFQVCRVTAAAVFVLQIIVAMNVFFGDGPTDTLRQSERRPEYLMLAWMYSTTLLILVGSVVYVPGRILSRTKTLKVRDWTALTLTCWLAVFALAVALYLPLHWPWSIGFIAPPNASISSAP